MRLSLLEKRYKEKYGVDAIPKTPAPENKKVERPKTIPLEPEKKQRPRFN